MDSPYIPVLVPLLRAFVSLVFAWAVLFVPGSCSSGGDTRLTGNRLCTVYTPLLAAVFRCFYFELPLLFLFSKPGGKRVTTLAEPTDWKTSSRSSHLPADSSMDQKSNDLL